MNCMSKNNAPSCTHQPGTTQYTAEEYKKMLEKNEFPGDIFGKKIKVTGSYSAEEKKGLRQAYLKMLANKNKNRLQTNPDFLKEQQEKFKTQQPKSREASISSTRQVFFSNVNTDSESDTSTDNRTDRPLSVG